MTKPSSNAARIPEDVHKFSLDVIEAAKVAFQAFRKAFESLNGDPDEKAKRYDDLIVAPNLWSGFSLLRDGPLR